MGFYKLACCLLVLAIVQVQETTAVYECMAGRWGQGCGGICGHCMGGGEFCQVYDGLCTNGCASGYKGIGCNETCEHGRYGPYCTEECGKCSSKRHWCNKETGHCDLGCEVGFQLPYCKKPCPHLRFGENCMKKCNCSDDCGCNPSTGSCHYTCDPSKYIKYRQDPEYVSCINQHAIKQVISKYKPPDVLEIPWLPILSIVGVLFFFVLSNFIWWWFLVRQPSPPEDKIEVNRGHKPDHISANRDTVVVLSRIRKKLGLDEFSRADSPVHRQKKPAFLLVQQDDEENFVGNLINRRQSAVDAFPLIRKSVNEEANGRKSLKVRPTVDFSGMEDSEDDSPFTAKVIKRRESAVDVGVLSADLLFPKGATRRHSRADSTSGQSRASSYKNDKTN